MKRKKIAEYRVTSKKELNNLLEVAESCGYTWYSGAMPTRFDPVEDSRMRIAEETINLWTDATITYGNRSENAELFTGELPMVIYGTERPKPVRTLTAIEEDIAEATKKEEEIQEWIKELVKEYHMVAGCRAETPLVAVVPEEPKGRDKIEEELHEAREQVAQLKLELNAHKVWSQCMLGGYHQWN